MWKWLHPYAKPETQYRICGKLSPLFAFFNAYLTRCWHCMGLSIRPSRLPTGQ